MERERGLTSSLSSWRSSSALSSRTKPTSLLFLVSEGNFLGVSSSPSVSLLRLPSLCSFNVVSCSSNMSVTISSDSTLVGDTTSSSGDIVDLSASPVSNTDMMSHLSRHRWCLLGHDHRNSRTVGSRLWRRDDLRRLPRGGNQAPPLFQWVRMHVHQSLPSVPNFPFSLRQPFQRSDRRTSKSTTISHGVICNALNCNRSVSSLNFALNGELERRCVDRESHVFSLMLLKFNWTVK